MPKAAPSDGGTDRGLPEPWPELQQASAYRLGSMVMEGDPHLSAKSGQRFGAVVNALSSLRPLNSLTLGVALADRMDPALLHRLDLSSGGLGQDGQPHDVIILDRDAATRISDDLTSQIKATLAKGGVMVVRRQSGWSFQIGRLLRRRRDDKERQHFLRGMDRAEAALVRAGLHVSPLTVETPGRRKEHWIVGSVAPLRDTRFRDQIGRVATDYLRLVGPLVIASALPLS